MTGGQKGGHLLQRELAARLAMLASAAWEPAVAAERGRQVAAARRAHGEFISASKCVCVDRPGHARTKDQGRMKDQGEDDSSSDANLSTHCFSF